MQQFTTVHIVCKDATATTGTNAWNWFYNAAKVASGKKLTALKTITLDGTDNTTHTLPSTSSTVARTDAAQTFSGTQNFTGLLTVNPAGTGTTLTNPTIQNTNSVDNFTQVSIQNKSTGVNASADLIAYPDNNTNDTTGFADIGITGSNFAQAAYAITTPNDAYFFGSAVSGAGKLGNLVIATDSTGSSNSIVFGVNGFSSLNKERARIDGATGTLSLGYQAVANGKLQFKNSTNSFTQTFTGSNP